MISVMVQSGADFVDIEKRRYSSQQQFNGAARLLQTNADMVEANTLSSKAQLKSLGLTYNIYRTSATVRFIA